MSNEAQLLSPERESVSLVRGEYELLVAQSDHFGWRLRWLDAGEFAIIFVAIEKSPERVFCARLCCQDYPQLAPELSFIDPELFESADQATEPQARFYPQGSYVDCGRGPFPVLCIPGHRDYYAGGWHQGWSVPPLGEHRLVHHVANLRNAILTTWQ